MTGREYRAIGIYAQEHDLKLTISTPPIIYFIENGLLIDRHLDHILSFYDSFRKERAKERKRKGKS